MDFLEESEVSRLEGFQSIISAVTLGSRAADYLNLAFLIPQQPLIPEDQYFGLISIPVLSTPLSTRGTDSRGRV